MNREYSDHLFVRQLGKWPPIDCLNLCLKQRLLYSFRVHLDIRQGLCLYIATDQIRLGWGRQTRLGMLMLFGQQYLSW